MDFNNIRLVLCDDNSSDLETLRTLAEDYINLRGFHGDTFCFSSPKDVLQFSEKVSDYDTTVYLLDVIMPEFDGIELGKRIRGHDKDCAVIYISSSKEYSLDAFSVRAFSYLIKPFSAEKLFDELDECLNRLNVKSQKILIKSDSRIVSVLLSQITVVEYFDHRLIYRLTDGGIIEGAYRKQPFDIQAEEIMQTGLFLKISASHLINAKNVQGVKADRFIMCDGTSYTVTRKYSDARKKYIEAEMRKNKGFFR